VQLRFPDELQAFAGDFPCVKGGFPMCSKCRYFMCVPSTSIKYLKFNTKIDVLLSSVKPGKKTFVVVRDLNLAQAAIFF